jgi:Protein of unknown function (DUF3631)
VVDMPVDEPSPDQAGSAPVDGQAVIERIVSVVIQYIVVSRAAALVSALWVIHTHAFEAANYTPYLFIKSATRRCGKSRLLDVLMLLVARPILVGDTTVAALFRSILDPKPTLLLDEQDGLRRGLRDSSDDMRRMMNAGSERGRTVRRCEQVGRKQEVVAFDVFCPKALAGIGNLPDTVMDRALTVELERKRPNDKVDRFTKDDADALAAPLRAAAARWAEDNLAALKGAKPTLPDALDDRAKDIAEPLLAIADLAGGRLPADAREAIIGLRRVAQAEDGDRRVDLLGDIRAAYDECGKDFLASNKLVEALTRDESSQWCEWRRGDPITSAALARQLKHFHIYPHAVQIAGVQTRGYRRTQFEEAFERYLPSDDATKPPEVDSRIDTAAPAEGEEEEGVHKAAVNPFPSLGGPTTPARPARGIRA